jgi:hypothetical protein
VPKHKRLRILAQVGSEFRRLFWLKRYTSRTQDIVMFGGYGSTGKPADVAHEFPEQVIGPEFQGTTAVMTGWNEGEPSNISFDHLACHADGTISLKHRAPTAHHHRKHPIVELSAESPIFLDFMFVTMPIGSYSVHKKDKNPYVSLIAKSTDTLVTGTVLVSGAKYPLEQDIAKAYAKAPPGSVAGGLLSDDIKLGMVFRPLLETEILGALPVRTNVVFRRYRPETKDRALLHLQFD